MLEKNNKGIPEKSFQDRFNGKYFKYFEGGKKRRLWWLHFFNTGAFLSFKLAFYTSVIIILYSIYFLHLYYFQPSTVWKQCIKQKLLYWMGLIVWQQKNKANCAGWVINKGCAQTSWQLLHHKISAAESVLVAFTTVLFYNIPLFPLWRLTVLSVSLCVRTCQLTFIMDVLVLIRAMLESPAWNLIHFFLSSSPLDTGDPLCRQLAPKTVWGCPPGFS